MYYCISMKFQVKKYKILIFFKISAIILVINQCSYSQLKNENFALKWGSWLLLQTIPSPGFYEDRSEINIGNNSSGIKFGFSWQVTPISYSWNANEYVSNFSFFHIKPVKRFSGSGELFFEPVIIPGGFNKNNLNKFMFKTGIRLVFPVFHGGEYMSVSLGSGYYEQRSDIQKHSGITYEAGIYSFFGMLGLKFNYNQNALSRYNIGLYIKYY